MAGKSGDHSGMTSPYIPSSRVWATYDPALIPSTTYFPVGMLRPILCDGDVLDLGCGIASNLPDLLSCGPSSLVGIDVNHKAIQRARILTKSDYFAYFVVGDAGILPIKDNSFDVVTAQALLTVIPTAEERISILGEASRVLRPDGYIYLGEFLLAQDLPHYRHRYDEGERLTGECGSFLVEEPTGNALYLAHHFSVAELTLLLESSNFKVLHEETKPALTRSGNKLTGISILARQIQ
jgi:SAM-dependent methyltransferase